MRGADASALSRMIGARTHDRNRSMQGIVTIIIDHHHERIIGSSLQRFQHTMVSNIIITCSVRMPPRCYVWHQTHFTMAKKAAKKATKKVAKKATKKAAKKAVKKATKKAAKKK